MQNTQFPSLAQQPKHTATEMQSGTAHQRPVETTKNTGHRNTVCYSLSMSTVETTHTQKKATEMQFVTAYQRPQLRPHLRCVHFLVSLELCHMYLHISQMY